MGKEKFVLDDGTETNVMSDYIRQEFKKDKTRRQIQEELSEKLGKQVSIRTIYSATARMENANVKSKTPVYVEFSDGSKMLRTEYIRNKVVNERVTIPEVAEELNIPYQTVYTTVKDYDDLPVKSIGKNRTIEVNGEEIVWKDYIIQRYNKGLTVSEIADEMNEEYQSVYQVIYKERKKDNLREE